MKCKIRIHTKEKQNRKEGNPGRRYIVPIFTFIYSHTIERANFESEGGFHLYSFPAPVIIWKIIKLSGKLQFLEEFDILGILVTQPANNKVCNVWVRQQGQPITWRAAQEM